MSGSDSDLRKWITSVRNDESKSSFCKKIYHFQTRNDGMTCINYGRGTIANWESGTTSPPRDVETILSIALIEYDKTHCYDDKGIDRYFFARKRLNEMLGVDLWCRNLHDAILVLVCRGLIGFEEVVDIESRLHAQLKTVPLTKAEKDELAIERKTKAISDYLIRVNSVEDACKMIMTDYSGYFASQHWLAGSRLRRIYEKRNRFHDMAMPLKMAVVNLAPNYINSYNNMFNGSFLSRDWLIDLCMHLRFSREEINEVLDATHKAALGDDEIVPENYSFLKGKPLYELLRIMLLIGVYIKRLESITEIPPAEYMLEPFRMGFEPGRAVLRQIDKYTDESLRSGDEPGPDEISKEPFAYKYIELVDRVFDDELFCPDIADACINDAKYYYSPPDEMISSQSKYYEAYRLLYCFATISFTVLTGRQYKGICKDSDLDDIRRLFRTNDLHAETIYNNMFNFITHILVTFLVSGDICETSDGKFYIANTSAHGKKKNSLDIGTIIDDLWASVSYLKEESDAIY